jgi:ABC-type transport system involved in cytochrome bd biosynthesis fused ATPase/permease subunit
MHDSPSPSRLLAKVLRDTLKLDGPFDSQADLVEALKVRCARFHISWHPDDLAQALAMVGSNVALPTLATTRKHLRNAPHAPLDTPPLTREESARFLANLRARYRERRHVS